MECLTFQRFPLAAGHPVHIRTGHGGAAGVGAVFSRACPALADALHHALLHGAGSGIINVYRTCSGVGQQLGAQGAFQPVLRACRRCHSTGSNKCVFDDIVNEVAPKLAEADAFVIGAPVYFGSPAGGAISFMDRLFFSTLNIDKTMKVGASVVTCRRGGNTASYDVLNKYFTMCGMPVASSQ